MQRIEIRNINSSKPTKPRMFDALIDDEGKIYFESKVHKNPESQTIGTKIFQESHMKNNIP
jgi:uncharacterized pyridoxamine 5'-phosphate oxidase family protein